tara:strand:+ start:161 stop:895 length:735 start_codon:yes stop_codon:yes gene_type:complete
MRKLLYFLVTTAFLYGTSCQSSGDKKNKVNSNLTFSEKHGLNKPWKTFLIENNVDLSNNVIPKSNKFESFLPENRYTNNHYGISVDFPNKWGFDRGYAEYTLYRCHQLDSAIVISLSVISSDSESKDEIVNLESQFQKAPIKTMGKSINGNYKTYMKNQILQQYQKIDNYKMTEEKIRNTNYIVIKYKYYETSGDLTVPFINLSFHTEKGGNTFTFNYSSPEIFFSQDLIYKVLFSVNYINFNF